MAAYVVVIRDKTRDPAELAAYSPKAKAASAGHPLTIRALHGRQRVLEGPDIEAVSILEFPTFEDAERWYDTLAYREALAHRLRGADYRAVIVEGHSVESGSPASAHGNAAR
jgi:uncharacterized protein (DUF1330 family)